MFASDGSFYEASLDKRYPSTKVGYVKVSSLILDVDKYRSLGASQSSRYIDPIKLNELESMTNALALALPSSNMRYKDAQTVADGFRLKLFEELNHPKTELPTAGRMLNTLFRMATMKGLPHQPRRPRSPDGAMVIFVHACPVCGHSRRGRIPTGATASRSQYATGPETCGDCAATDLSDGRA